MNEREADIISTSLLNSIKAAENKNRKLRHLEHGLKFRRKKKLKGAGFQVQQRQAANQR